MRKELLLVVLVVILLTGCSAIEQPESAPADVTPVAVDDPTRVLEATAVSTATVRAAEETVDEVSSAEALLASFTAPAQANGELLILYGQVLDVNGNPVPDAVVEIWQTDASGVYDHPGDSGTASRDRSFQFYGTATVDEAGWYAFRTIVPGRYEPRPRHIHFKVKQYGSTLLTSQFYFGDDVAEVAAEGMFRAVGESGDRLLLQLVQGEGTLLANGQIVVDTGIGAGTLPLTPSQGEGPYYPVVALADYDNDLATLE